MLLFPANYAKFSCVQSAGAGSEGEQKVEPGRTGQRNGKGMALLAVSTWTEGVRPCMAIRPQPPTTSCLLLVARTYPILSVHVRGDIKHLTTYDLPCPFAFRLSLLFRSHLLPVPESFGFGFGCSLRMAWFLLALFALALFGFPSLQSLFF